jgi:outer membrane lipoprotein-sorting protein
MRISILFLSIITLLSGALNAQIDASEIVRLADEKVRGTSSSSTIKMSIVRPEWTRDVTMQSWSKGDDMALILITAPARDKGVAFLKREKELWNWQPSINRTIKMPPSMMMQSWMGSDVTNDDLVKESSIQHDYTHKILGEEAINGRACYKIEMMPKEEAAVVWGMIIAWIDKVDYMQLKTEMYDEDGYLVNTMLGSDIKLFDNKLLPGIIEIYPADEPGQKTIIEYLELSFDVNFDDAFFSIQNLKRVRG